MTKYAPYSTTHRLVTAPLMAVQKTYCGIKCEKAEEGDGYVNATGRKIEIVVGSRPNCTKCRRSIGLE